MKAVAKATTIIIIIIIIIITTIIIIIKRTISAPAIAATLPKM